MDSDSVFLFFSYKKSTKENVIVIERSNAKQVSMTLNIVTFTLLELLFFVKTVP